MAVYKQWVPLMIASVGIAQLLACAGPEGGVSVEGDELESVEPEGSKEPSQAEGSDESSPEKDDSPGDSSPEPEPEASDESQEPEKESPEPESKKESPKDEPETESPKDDPDKEPEPEPEPEPEEDKEVSGDVEIAFTTKTFGGRYGPRNVGAVWIETKDGSFLRTVKVWAQRRAVHLVAWNKATKGSRVDAVSGATLRKHQSHEVKWDRKDAKGKEHGAGEYVLKMEITEENSSMSGILEGPFLELPFELGKGKKTEKAKDQEGFSGVEVKLPG